MGHGTDTEPSAPADQEEKPLWERMAAGAATSVASNPYLMGGRSRGSQMMSFAPAGANVAAAWQKWMKGRGGITPKKETDSPIMSFDTSGGGDDYA